MGHAVLVGGERRPLVKAALNRPRVLQLSRFEDRPGPKQLVDLPEVLRRRRADKQDVPRGSPSQMCSCLSPAYSRSSRRS
jgi:hypothetical protein